MEQRVYSCEMDNLKPDYIRIIGAEGNTVLEFLICRATIISVRSVAVSPSAAAMNAIRRFARLYIRALIESDSFI